MCYYSTMKSFFNINKKIQSLFGFITLFGYLTLLVVTPLHLIQMADMKMPMEHCPFEMTHDIICSASITEHLRTWQLWFEIFTPFSSAFIPVLFIAVFSLFYIPPLLTRLRLYSKRRKWQDNKQTITNLFSQGILHTKAF